MMFVVNGRKSTPSLLFLCSFGHDIYPPSPLWNNSSNEPGTINVLSPLLILVNHFNNYKTKRRAQAINRYNDKISEKLQKIRN